MVSARKGAEMGNKKVPEKKAKPAKTGKDKKAKKSCS